MAKASQKIHLSNVSLKTAQSKIDLAKTNKLNKEIYVV